MWFYVSENPNFSYFSNESTLVWHQTNIPYTVWGPQSTTTLSIQYHPSQGLKQNGSLYGNVFFARSGYSADPNDPEYLPLATFGRTHCQFHSLPSYVESQLAHMKKGQFF